MYTNPELEKQYNFKLSKTLSMPNRRNLFKNKKFYMTPGVVPGRNAMRDIIEYAGGSVDRQRRSLRFMQDQEPYSYFVITVPKDYHLVADALRSSLGNHLTQSEYPRICSALFLASKIVILKKRKSKLIYHIFYLPWGSFGQSPTLLVPYVI